MKYLILRILIALNPIPEVRNYWNNDTTNFGFFKNSIISNTLSRDDFHFIHRNLLLSRVEVQEIRTILNKNFQKY